MAEYLCNLCGKKNQFSGEPLERETPGCKRCGSSLRTRSLMYTFSIELFGTPLALPDFPKLKGLRGIGTSDSPQYSGHLAATFDYRNTFFDREPFLDLAHVPENEFGRYDFLISSEVFEHVPPPASRAFRNAAQMLKPEGLLVMTVPYEVEERDAREHYPDLFEYGFAGIGDRKVLVNRTRGGDYQVFEDPVFHRSDRGDSLEMRMFSEQTLRNFLNEAGFTNLKIHGENYPPFGIVHKEGWSLPIAARKGEFPRRPEVVRELPAQR